jgi:hypothetical protein
MVHFLLSFNEHAQVMAAESPLDGRVTPLLAPRPAALALPKKLPQRSEARANLFRKEVRLFPGRKVPALGDLVEVNKPGVRPLRPAPRSRIEFVGKDAHGNGDGDAFDAEIPEFAPILPIETGAGKRCVRQPRDRYVVEDVIARQAFGFSLKDA